MLSLLSCYVIVFLCCSNDLYECDRSPGWTWGCLAGRDLCSFPADLCSFPADLCSFPADLAVAHLQLSKWKLYLQLVQFFEVAYMSLSVVLLSDSSCCALPQPGLV